MGIHLVNVEGDRHVYLCRLDPCTHPDPDDAPTATARGLAPADLIGWIEQGRTRQGSRGSYTEWRFEPSAPGATSNPVRRNYSAAFEDARIHAKGI